MLSFEISDADTSATVTVESIGPEWQPHDSDYRERYAYSIITPEWRYDGNDIRSGCGADVDESDAARTLFSFLIASAEAFDATEHGRWTDNGDIFPAHVAEWASYNSDELSMLSFDPSDDDDNECEGHESLNGADMGRAVYCDGSCRR